MTPGCFRYLLRGGARFRRALGFVGLDFYPGTIYPSQLLPGHTIRGELAQAAGVVRRCLTRLAGIGSRTPLWITETGYPGAGSGIRPETSRSATAAANPTGTLTSCTVQPLGSASPGRAARFTASSSTAIPLPTPFK